MALIKIVGILLFAAGCLWTSHFTLGDLIPKNTDSENYYAANYIGALALAILAYKGFTTLTNSGDEITKPHKNVGRSIVLSLLICLFVYFFVAIAVNSNLSIPEIIKAKNYSLAEAAKPLYGNLGLYFTVGIAIIACISGIIASIFAVSRMTAMLTEMKLIPHKHFGMSGSVQKHLLLYIVVIGIALTIFFDLSRIASMGAFFYLVMDMIIHWGVYKHLRKDVKANPVILLAALLLDLIVLLAFVWIKMVSDPFIVISSVVGIVLVFLGERWFLHWVENTDESK